MMDTFNKTVTQVFEHQALSTPEAVAVSDQFTTLTYQQLNEKANYLAYHLREKGVAQGKFVAVFLEPSVEFIISILGIIKAGAAYIPLDVNLPKKRLEKLLNDANPHLLITDKKNYSVGFEINSTFLIENLQKNCPKHHANNTLPGSSSQDSIYMLYTSGSTGEPKGVTIPHCAVVNLAKTVNYAHVRELTTVAQFSHIAFDASTFEIWSALLNGATLVIVPSYVRQNYSKFKEFLLEYHVQYLFLPTGYFHQLIRLTPDALDGIQTLVIGGEKANASLMKTFLEYRKSKGLPLVLMNGYGPTEATVFSCRHIINSQDTLTEEELNTIGKDIPNVKLYVLDESQKPVRLGDEGELYISGINLALCYHQDSTLTKKNFIPNPFDNQFPFQKLYKTGDKVRQRSDGNFMYLGRIDDQVKVQGFRVHLSEIETQLLRHPAINTAVVLSERDASYRTFLTAYLLFYDSENALTSDQIKKYLSAQLPPYMLPTKYIKINQIPLTAVGKMDKKRLAEMEGVDLANVTIDSGNAIEKKLATIFSRLLKINHIDVTQNLFDLGMNSLLLVEAYYEINQEFQKPISLEAIITYPSIVKLSEHIQAEFSHINSVELK